MVRQILIIFFLLGWVMAYAQADAQLFTATGKEVRAEAINPGTWTCIGGEPTGANPPCSPGTKKILIRDVSNKYVYQEISGTAAAMLRGENITHVRADLDENYYGKLSCTFEWTVPEMNGRWVGTCSATGYPGKGILINKAVASGHGGKLEGLRLEFHAVNVGLPYSVFVAAVKNE